MINQIFLYTEHQIPLALGGGDYKLGQPNTAVMKISEIFRFKPFFEVWKANSHGLVQGKDKPKFPKKFPERILEFDIYAIYEKDIYFS